jgi:hypothetical protein
LDIAKEITRVAVYSFVIEIKRIPVTPIKPHCAHLLILFEQSIHRMGPLSIQFVGVVKIGISCFFNLHRLTLCVGNSSGTATNAVRASQSESQLAFVIDFGYWLG